MGATVDAVKTLFAPALISLIIFLTLTYVLVPFWIRYRNRYSQYLPLDTISNSTSSIRSRIQGLFARFMMPPLWRARASERVVVAERTSFDSEDGEELGDVYESTARRGVDQQRGNSTADNTRRLSRDLEEGFLSDESDRETERTRGR
ncbi:hypothetical protein VTK26DRAFT_8552 [Humicola hyalothermophila]